jgi:hypothetical protein
MGCHTNQVNQISRMTNTFMKAFVNTLMINLATIAAVIVGVVSYAYRAAKVWYAENGEDLRYDVSFQLAEFFGSLHFKFADMAGEFDDDV